MKAILEFASNNHFQQRLFFAKNPCYSDKLEQEIIKHFTQNFDNVKEVTVLYYDNLTD